MGFPDFKDRISESYAKVIRDIAKVVGDGATQKDCFWRGYRLEERCFIGLCDSLDMWETDEKTMVDHVVDAAVSNDRARIQRIQTKNDALKVIALAPKTRAWLKKNDPKALEQVDRALKA